MTTVINLRHHTCDIVCDRSSPFGNPYEIGRDGTRDDVCNKYAILFKKRLQDPDFRARVLALKGKRLGCWCKPNRCHVDTIKKFLDETG